MKSSDDLFQLIKSLNKNEKRYFRLFSNLQSGNKNYLLMFNAIEKQKVYDEQTIVSLFRRKKIASSFPLVKRYLYNFILSSLESYHSNIESELYSQLHRIDILYEKGLYAQCKKVIEKAKTLAVKYDLQLPLLRLMEWEVSIIKVQSFIGSDKNTVGDIFSKIFRSIEQYKISNDYYLSHSLLFLREIKNGTIRKHSDIEELKKIMATATPAASPKSSNMGRTSLTSKTNNKLEQRDENSLPVELEGCGWTILYRYYLTYGHYFWLLNNHEQAYSYWEKAIQLLEEKPYQIGEKPLNYIGTLRNLFVSAMYMKRYKKCADIIQKMKALQVKSKKVRGRIDFLTNEMSVWLCIETGAFKEGIELITSREEMKSMILLKGEIPIVQYNIAYLYFGMENYRKANKHLNNIVNISMDTGNDIQCFAQILSLLVHFEMRNQDLLEYAVKSTYRFLFKRDKLYKVENIILDFIRKELPKIHSQKALLKSFEILLTKIKPLATDPFERRAFDYFDFISWLKSKIEERPFAEVVREKAEKINE